MAPSILGIMIMINILMNANTIYIIVIITTKIIIFDNNNNNNNKMTYCYFFFQTDKMGEKSQLMLGSICYFSIQFQFLIMK